MIREKLVAQLPQRAAVFPCDPGFESTAGRRAPKARPADRQSKLRRVAVHPGFEIPLVAENPRHSGLPKISGEVVRVSDMTSSNFHGVFAGDVNTWPKCTSPHSNANRQFRRLEHFLAIVDVSELRPEDSRPAGV
jgi:hypothetical protein